MMRKVRTIASYDVPHKRVKRNRRKAKQNGVLVPVYPARSTSGSYEAKENKRRAKFAGRTPPETQKPDCEGSTGQCDSELR